VLALVGGVFLTAQTAAAQSAADTSQRLVWRWERDLPVTLGGFALAKFVPPLFVAREERAYPPHKQRSGDPGTFDRRLLPGWPDPVTAARLSDWTSLLSLAPATLADGRLNKQDLTTIGIALEAAAVTALATELTKWAALRQRPYVHDLSPGSPPGSDHNKSFFSGHTSLAFALAVAGGTTADIRGDRYRRRVWASGLTLATTTGYLRMAGRKHYFTDVVAGALVGSAIGHYLPRWLHKQAQPATPRAVEPTTTAPSVPLVAQSFGRHRPVFVQAGLTDGGFAFSVTWNR